MMFELSLASSTKKSPVLIVSISALLGGVIIVTSPFALSFLSFVTTLMQVLDQSGFDTLIFWVSGGNSKYCKPFS